MGVQQGINLVLAKRSDLHLLRKVWHVATGGACLYGYYFIYRDIRFWAHLTLAIAICGFLSDFVRTKNEKFNQFVISIMGPFMRNSEKEGFTGLPFYALGASISLYFFKPEIALISIFYLVLADPISSIFGILFGKDKILPNKSLQGALAGFVVCYFVTLAFTLGKHDSPNDVLIFALLGGLIGTISELISAFNIDDNLSIPVLSGLGLTLVNELIPIF